MIYELIQKYDYEFSEQVLVFGSRSRARWLLFITMLISFALIFTSYGFIYFKFSFLSLIFILLSIIPASLVIIYRMRKVKKLIGRTKSDTIHKESLRLLKKHLDKEKLTVLIDELIVETNRQAEKAKNPFYLFIAINGVLLIPIWISVVNKFIEMSNPLSDLMFIYTGFLIFLAISISVLIVLIHVIHDDMNSKYSKLNKIGSMLNEIRLERLRSKK